MANARTNIATVDPVWDQIQTEAQNAVRDEPLIGGFVHATILHHKSIEKALSYRIAAKLASNEMSMMVVHEMVEEAFASDPDLIKAARADLVAIFSKSSQISIDGLNKLKKRCSSAQCVLLGHEIDKPTFLKLKHKQVHGV